MRKILITGINGFVGSNCAKYFTQSGDIVFGIDVYGESCSNFIQGEVNLENLQAFKQNFDVIIHLAGSGTVGSAQQNPEIEYKKTVKSSHEILEYIKNYNKNAKLIYSSSAAVYGDLYEESITEQNLVNPISVYGKQKLEVENLCERYSKDFNLKINIIRFFSIYGEGLKKQLLWDFTNRVYDNVNSKTLQCFGTGEEKRDFIHINDAIELIDILIEQNNNFDIINCGTGKVTSVNSVLKLICDELNYHGQLVFDNIIRNNDPKSIVANIDKAIEIGFDPKIEIESGIKNYVNWFKQNN